METQKRIDYMNNKQKYYGIIPPIVTPLLSDETLDIDAMQKLIEHCIDGGVNGVFVNGTSGEAMRVTESVWEQSTNTAIQYINGRIHVFCGAIDTSTKRVIDKIKKIEDLGGQLAVCCPPFYLNSFGQSEILRHYDAICNKTNIEIAVYNIPETTHVCILPETATRLAENKKIAAYKDSSADWQLFQRLLFALEEKDIALFNGAEELCFASMMFGAQGCIPGLANYIPELFYKLYDLCKSGNIIESYELQKRINRIRRCLFVNGCWMSSMKYLLKVFNLGQDFISSPLETLTYGEQSELFKILNENGIEFLLNGEQ